MAEVKVIKGLCVYWRGCSRPPTPGGGRFCAEHSLDRKCLACGTANPPKLTRQMCSRCYSWWRRHESDARPRILADDRERSRRYREAAA